MQGQSGPITPPVSRQPGKFASAPHPNREPCHSGKSATVFTPSGPEGDSALEWLYNLLIVMGPLTPVHGECQIKAAQAS